MTPPTTNALDAAVGLSAEAILGRKIRIPDGLLLLATGTSGLTQRLDGHEAIPFSELPGAPEAWHGLTLHAGALNGTDVWLLDDAASDGASGWHGAFPVWLAASLGVRILVHTSAGTALDAGSPLQAGSIARLVDHINLSGASPLTGLGESRLGPLFPDQTRLHDAELGALASAGAARTDVELGTAVAACTLGPALATPAELRWFRASGADVAVQRLASPLVAAAHAGLQGLAFTAITDVAGEHLGIAELVARTAGLAPSLDHLIAALMPDIRNRAQALREDEETA